MQGAKKHNIQNLEADNGVWAEGCRPAFVVFTAQWRCWLSLFLLDFFLIPHYVISHSLSPS